MPQTKVLVTPAVWPEFRSTPVRTVRRRTTPVFNPDDVVDVVGVTASSQSFDVRLQQQTCRVVDDIDQVSC
jgi:prophage antirepressor-like protein